MSALLEGPMLWYINRGTGLTVLVLLSLSTALGVLTTGGRPAGDGGGRLILEASSTRTRNMSSPYVRSLTTDEADRAATTTFAGIG